MTHLSIRMIAFGVLMSAHSATYCAALQQPSLGDLAFEGKLDDMKVLIAAGDAPFGRDASKRSVMDRAIYGGRLAVVQYLLDNYPTLADIEETNMPSDIKTPLMLATQLRKVAIIEALLRAGADRHKKHYDSKTPEDVASQFKNSYVLKAYGLADSK